MKIVKRTKRRSRCTGWRFVLPYNPFEIKVTLNKTGWFRIDLAPGMTARYGDEIEIHYKWGFRLTDARPSVSISTPGFGKPRLTIQ